MDKHEFIFSYSEDQGISEYDFPLHMHNFYEIYFFLEGGVNYYIEGAQYLLEPYDLLIINPSELHRPFFNDKRSYKRITIHFLPSILTSFKDEAIKLLDIFHMKDNPLKNRLPSSMVKAYALDSYKKV